MRNNLLSSSTMIKSLQFSLILLLFSSGIFGLEDSDIIPVKVIGYPGGNRQDYARTQSDSTYEQSLRNNRREERLVDSKCLKCICYGSTKCQSFGCDESGEDSYFCGPFQASWAYWSDAGKPTVPGGLPRSHDLSFEECLKDYNCSSEAVIGYMTKHQQDCDNNQVVDCYDFARIHKAGAYSCDSAWNENQPYWTQFLDCMDDRVHVTLSAPKKDQDDRDAHNTDDLEAYGSSQDRQRPDVDLSRPSDRSPSTSVAAHRLVDDKCLSCICYANTKCEPRSCTGAANICGPFQATWSYWADGGKPTVPGGLAVDHPHSFEECLKDYNCSSRAVEGYMTKHQKDCDGDNVIGCYDFAVMHKAGAYGCPADWLKKKNSAYWNQFEDCMSGDASFRIPYDNKAHPKKIQHESSNRDQTDDYPSGRTDVGTVATSRANVDDKCLKCICYASTKCQAKECVNSGPESYFCGPFQGSWLYWSEGGKPTVPGGLGADHKHAFEECLKDYTCSAKAVKGYMNKHHQDCNSDGVENCYDYARIHKAGPYSCGSVGDQTYWNQFLECMNDQVDVSLPGETPTHRNQPSSGNSGNRDQSQPDYNVWHAPPAAGPYDPPATVRPASNARLPPFVPEKPHRPANHQDRYQPATNQNSRRPPVTDNRQRPSGSNNRRQPSGNQNRRKPIDVRSNLVDDKCLQCLCYASSECQALGCQNAGPESYFCGPFQATWAYWKEAGSPTVPGGLDASHKHAFEECLKDYDCAAEAIQGYMRKYHQDCNNDYVTDCYDFAKIHKVGGYTCNTTSIESSKYWTRLNDCLDGYVTFE